MSLSVGSSSFFLIYKSALLSLLSEHLASSLLHFFLSRAVICISIFCLDLLFKKPLYTPQIGSSTMYSLTSNCLSYTSYFQPLANQLVSLPFFASKSRIICIGILFEY